MLLAPKLDERVLNDVLGIGDGLHELPRKQNEPRRDFGKTNFPIFISGDILHDLSKGLSLTRRRQPAILFTFVRNLFAVAVIVSTSPVPQQPERPQEAVRTIVNREHEFSGFAREHGRRAAFLEFCADDAVIFNPGPVNAKQLWTKRPEDNSLLVWQPDFAAVARACDIGYDTGPWEFKKNKAAENPDVFGDFVSVWRKQKDGRWKVAVDYGIEHAQLLGEPKPAEMFYSDDGRNEAVDTRASRKAARAARDAFLKAAGNDSAAALLGVADASIRVYRQGLSPAIGREAAGVMLGTTTGKLKMESSGGGMSRTGDLGYDYGSYRFKRGESSEAGHYLQIWHTDANGAWKLVLDLERKLPPELDKKKTSYFGRKISSPIQSGFATPSR